MPSITPQDEPTFPIHPEDADEVQDAREYLSCQSHCCVRHGCKYGYEGCPVFTRQVVQAHSCEQCTDELYEAAMYGDAPYPKSGEVGYRVVLAASRPDAADGEAMAGMPDDEAVAAKVAQALAGLDLGGGWTIARVV